MTDTSTPIDFNQIAGQAVAEVAKEAVRGTTSAISRKLNSARASMRSGFDKYFRASAKRTGFVKTLVSQSEPIDFYDIYVPLDFTMEDITHTDESVIDQISSRRKILIRGLAGEGKSIFIKHVNNRLMRNLKDGVPIFFELRSLNHDFSRDLISTLYDSMAKSIPYLDHSHFYDSVKTGRYVLILDGFDEVNFEHRERYAVELNEFSLTFPDSKIVITSRPDELVSTLQAFHVFDGKSMSLEQCVTLIGKIPYDDEKKTEFIERVKTGLHKSHETFLSNPLLTTMMLVTFGEFSEVPNKIHLFYQQAFEALYYKHDRSKGVYTRKSYSNLSIDDFQKVLSYFCAASFSKESFSMTEEEARTFVRKSLTYNHMDLEESNFVKDLVESVCIMQKDGTDLNFVHRSFQEYFTAKFLSSLENTEFVSAIDSIVQKRSDRVIVMLADMDEVRFGELWTLPVTERLVDAFYTEGKRTLNVRAAMHHLYTHVIPSPPTFGALDSMMKPDSKSMFTIRSCYPNLFPRFLDEDEEVEYMESLMKDNAVLREQYDHFNSTSDRPIGYEDDRLHASPIERAWIEIDDIPEPLLTAITGPDWITGFGTGLKALADELSAKKAERQSSLSGLFD